jgi:nucleotide-binding universal stress UspA family protein
MKRLKKILVPTDLSENSRRAIDYGGWLAAEDKAALVILHVTSELNAWDLNGEEFPLMGATQKVWPIDRVLAEASLDLNHFLERHLDALKNVPCVTKRVLFGSIVGQIVGVAEEERADLIVMSPERRRGLRHVLIGGVTDRVTRLSPCPVLSITAPLPSRTWRGRWIPLFGWPRQRPAPV